MGFLAYLLLGSLMGWAAAHYFPGFSPRNKGTNRSKLSKVTYLWSLFFGVLGTVLVSYGGQVIGLFIAGQILEWGSAIVGGFLMGSIYMTIQEINR